MGPLRLILVALLATGVCDARGHFGAGGRGGRGEDGPLPKKTLKDRLEKFDRLVDMANKGKVNIPNLKDRVEDLKQREANLMEREESLDMPKMPLLEGNPFAHDPADMDDDRRMGMPGLGSLGVGSRGGMPSEASLAEEDMSNLTPREQAARKVRMEKARIRLEKMKHMSTDERLDFLKKERESAPPPGDGEEEGGLMGLLGEGFDPLGKEGKTWRSNTGDFGPPMPKNSKKEARREALLRLSKEERHDHIREHQQAMHSHRENMEVWRETHASYMDERREIMDAYRTISHEIREAIFANRDLR